MSQAFSPVPNPISRIRGVVAEERLEIIDKVMYLNGKRLILTGVNRHEWNAKTGRVIGMDEMISDMKCVKRNNINAVTVSYTHLDVYKRQRFTQNDLEYFFLIYNNWRG